MQEVGQKWSNTVGIDPILAHFRHSMAYVQRISIYASSG